MHVTDVDGNEHDALALNEVSLFRTTYQAVKVEIVVDGRTQMEELICDGILLSTPAGSTAYNLSAHGPILPIDSPLLALTPISPFRPRRWRGAILPNTAVVTFKTRETDKRPVSAVADNVEFKAVKQVIVQEDRTHQVTLLFDPGTGPRRARPVRAVPLLGGRQRQPVVTVDRRQSPFTVGVAREGCHHAARRAPCQSDILLAEIGERILELERDDAFMLDDQLLRQCRHDEMARGEVVGEVGGTRRGRSAWRSDCSPPARARSAPEVH